MRINKNTKKKQISKDNNIELKLMDKISMCQLRSKKMNILRRFKNEVFLVSNSEQLWIVNPLAFYTYSLNRLLEAKKIQI